MEEVRANGVCLSSRKRGENDKMLTVFCEDGNLYDVLARGALKHTSKLKFATQLFSVCDYFLCPSKAGYYILGGAAFTELSFASITNDPDNYTAACLVCEVAAKCVKTENKRMYAETVAALAALAAGDADTRIVCLRILLAALESCGWGGALPIGARGEVCRTVLDAQLGSLGGITADKEITAGLVKTYGSQFAVHFGKLNSLLMM